MRDLLTFYAELAEFQKGLLSPRPEGRGVRTGETFRDALDTGPALEAIPTFREWLSTKAPAFVGGDDADAFINAALIQPFAEQLAADWPREQVASSSACPVCEGAPTVGLFRPDGQSARRALICAFCLTEHEFMRVLCPSCGEDRFDALPVFTADQFGHVRIDACDSCHTYIKTIDLTKDGYAVPVVDDIATVALDVWAREHGYERIQRSLLGL